eukprot:TRINITY_DN84_c2_g3_i1.p1 TRINITY_DN84_c2_g3~~TRINITY_DN84_c2_g3_i1.p1  ORF type:complete len:204 (-),score=95.20 TRINITY_DN84_c2_g3_i1:100-711(-)
MQTYGTAFASTILPETFQAAANPQLAAPTLDEPVSRTLLRELKLIGTKLFYVVLPRGKGSVVLRDWDLWGPLLICLFLATCLSISAKLEDQALAFTEIFVIITIGAIVITVNSSVLGGVISFFQSVCVLGYCLFPLALASLFCLFWDNLIFRFCVVAPCWAWSTFASLGFLSSMVPPHRRALSVYPVCFFFLTIAWITLTTMD